jgi:transposase
MEKQDGRKRTPDALQEIRYLVVSLKKKGHTNKGIAQMVGLSKGGVCRIWKLYRMGGEEGLVLGKRGKPPKKKLSDKEGRHVQKWIIDKMPDQLKLPFALWTREAVAKLIDDRFAVRVSKWTVGRYLREWGFTPQKPVLRAYEQNPKEVQQWLDHEYPLIKERSEAENGVIYWGDETGMRSDHHAGRTYGLKGETPVITVSGKRFGANMISAITNKGELKFKIFEGRFVTEVFLDFLTRLIHRSRRKIFFIVDGHPVHKANRVHKWLKAHSDRIELFFLPSYSPEINPDEYLNQDVKTNAVGKRRPHNLAELVTNVKSFLEERKNNPEKVKAYFGAWPVRYAA